MAIPILGLLDAAIDKIVPDAAERQRLKMEAARLDLEGEFKPLELRMNAIIAEAQSDDPWTSRARPSFMYVVYTYILAAIPMGFFIALKPEVGAAVIEGVKGWLESIPPGMWATFAAGYLGYVVKRSQDKAVRLGQPVESGLISKLLG